MSTLFGGKSRVLTVAVIGSYAIVLGFLLWLGVIMLPTIRAEQKASEVREDEREKMLRSYIEYQQEVGIKNQEVILTRQKENYRALMAELRRFKDEWRAERKKLREGGR
jgi:lysylphosphatidylglycerol synthetase-like protein (DUF2156 family)